MKRTVLFTIIAAGLWACDQSGSSNTGGAGGLGSGMDVGSIISSNFVETTTQPEQVGCEGTGWRFDDRTQQGQKWTMVRDVRRPGMTARESLTATVEEATEDKVTITNEVSLAVEGNQPQNASFTVDTDVSGAEPVVTVTPDNPGSVAPMAEILKFENDESCKFTQAGQGQQDVKQGRFTLSGGQALQSSTLTTQTAEGSFECKDSDGQVVSQEDKAKLSVQTITSFEIPNFMPFNQCEATPIYVYQTVADENGVILASSREEIQKYEAPAAPAPGTPAPGAPAESEEETPAPGAPAEGEEATPAT
jgi:hypothetical protein